MKSGFSENRIKELLFDHFPYSVIWLDEIGKVVFANNKFCEKLGYNKEEITKLSIFDINPMINAKIWKEHWKLIESKGSAVFQTTHKNKNGKLNEVEVFSAYFQNKT